MASIPVRPVKNSIPDNSRSEIYLAQAVYIYPGKFESLLLRGHLIGSKSNFTIEFYAMQVFTFKQDEVFDKEQEFETNHRCRYFFFHFSGETIFKRLADLYSSTRKVYILFTSAGVPLNKNALAGGIEDDGSSTRSMLLALAYRLKKSMIIGHDVSPYHN
jgi:hypothetical protein